MQRRNKIIVAMLLVVAIITVGFTVWAYTPPAPMPEALAALQSDSQIKVSTDRWLVFEPTQSEKSTAFIIYPGGRVDARSYAPAARAIAGQGYLTIIAPMPFNLARFRSEYGQRHNHRVPQSHLMGDRRAFSRGTMAAQFAHDNPYKIKGLVLWAAYPASGTNLSSLSLSAVTIRGTNDGLVSNEQIRESLTLLPFTTTRIEITGGNHAQFGWYGDQAGDNAATITREIQQNQTIDATVQMLSKL